MTKCPRKCQNLIKLGPNLGIRSGSKAASPQMTSDREALDGDGRRSVRSPAMTVMHSALTVELERGKASPGL